MKAGRRPTCIRDSKTFISVKMLILISYSIYNTFPVLCIRKYKQMKHT
jgi:hypothetical protein